MIAVDKKQAGLLLSLPKNEDSFGALVAVMTKHRDRCVQEFNFAAQRAVFDETVRQSALTLSGQVKAMNDVIDMFNTLTVGKIDG